jgi:hypothetical protein
MSSFESQNLGKMGNRILPLIPHVERVVNVIVGIEMERDNQDPKQYRDCYSSKLCRIRGHLVNEKLNYSVD